MTLSLDRVRISTPDPPSSCEFYCSAFDLDPTSVLDLHGGGELAFDSAPMTPTSGAFVALSYIVEHRTQVMAIIDAAAGAGATVLKAPRRRFSGEFAASFGSPDGTLWKVASLTARSAAPASDPACAVRVGVVLGVPELPDTRAFYVRRGLVHDTDHGKRFVDFAYTPPGFKITLMPTRALAKRLGVQPDATSHLTFCTRSELAEPITDPVGNRWESIAR